MKLYEILTDIHALETELLSFERKYGIRSETFYAAYAAGEEPEDDNWVPDFGEWASVYRTWLGKQSEYRNEIQCIQQYIPSLTGLVRIAYEQSVPVSSSAYDYRLVRLRSLAGWGKTVLV